jgi:MoaA/NifB/PqqE/SkfB family radical SAM enzyme
MPLEEFSKILEVIHRNDHDLRIINFTGGEPTLHPQFTSIIRLCHDAGIHRVTISTHGLTFLKNEALLAELASLNARIVLSFNSFDEAINKKMLGGPLFAKKMKVLDLLEKYNVDTTLIPVLALGVNDHEMKDLVELMLGRKFLRSLGSP